MKENVLDADPVDQLNQMELVSQPRIGVMIKLFFGILFFWGPLFIVLLILIFGSIIGIGTLLNSVTHEICRSLNGNDLCYVGLGLFDLVLGFFIFIIGFSIVYKGLHLFGSKKVVDLPKSVESPFETNFEIKNAKKLLFTYTLSAKTPTLSEFLRVGIRPEALKLIKKKLPNFKYYNQFNSYMSDSKNYAQFEELINKMTPDERDELLALFQDTLKVTITNLESGETIRPFMESTFTLGGVIKPLVFYNKKDNPELFQDGNIKVTIKYSGLKGYSFKLWTK